MFLPSWFIAFLAFLAAAECIWLSVYLMRTHDHLIMRASDVGTIGCFVALVGVHYVMIYISSDFVRSVALSRIAWSLFFGADVVIMARYIFAIRHSKVVSS